MSSLLPVFYVFLLLVPFNTDASHEESQTAEWWEEKEQRALQEHLKPLETYNNYVVPHFIRYLIPGMIRRSIPEHAGYGKLVGLPISTRTRYSPDFGYQTRYSVAEDAAQDTLLRLKLLNPHGAGRRRRDTDSVSRLFGKQVLALTKRH